MTTVFFYMYIQWGRAVQHVVVRVVVVGTVLLWLLPGGV